MCNAMRVPIGIMNAHGCVEARVSYLTRIQTTESNAVLPCARTSILSDLVQCVHRRNGRENDLCRRKNSPQPKIQAFVQTAVWTLQTGLIRTSRGARPIAVRAAPNKPAVRAMSTKERLPDNLRLPGPRSLIRPFGPPSPGGRRTTCRSFLLPREKVARRAG